VLSKNTRSLGHFEGRNGELFRYFRAKQLSAIRIAIAAFRSQGSLILFSSIFGVPIARPPIGAARQRRIQIASVRPRGVMKYVEGASHGDGNKGCESYSSRHQNTVLACSWVGVTTHAVDD
jgi:hypothetical protein